jgi:hypothetical protein
MLFGMGFSVHVCGECYNFTDFYVFSLVSGNPFIYGCNPAPTPPELSEHCGASMCTVGFQVGFLRENLNTFLRNSEKNPPETSK